MAENLTPIERKVYNYLLDFLAENTYQPSIREIGRKFRIKSTKTVSDLLQSLSAKGFIERDPSRSRGVRIVGYTGPTRVQALPYYGKIHAGDPALIPEHREGQIALDRRFVPGDDAFFLKVTGDSMNGRGIVDGDYVVVSPSAPPRDGDIVAARLGAEATVKTYTIENGAVVLVPANSAEKAIVPKPTDDFSVLGVVCGVFRPFFDRQAFDGAIMT
jgi:repressor LexA